ncbi:MAG: cytochrome ubiquinol oxidase subunit I, partial [Bacteroidota bacterium]
AIFQFYHIMISIGMFLIGLTLYASFRWWKGDLFQQKWLLQVFVLSVILPQIANQVGWYAAEMGRQPWVVYGLLRTSDALSQAVTANQVWFSLIMFTIIYVILFTLFIYLLNKKIKHGPYEENGDSTRSRQKDMVKVFK